MPTFKFKSPEGKSYTVNGPEGSTAEQAFEILQGQLGIASPKKASDQIPTTRYRPPTQQDIQRSAELAAPDRTYKDDNLLGNIVGPVDAGAALLSSMAGGVVAPIGGFIQAAMNPNSAKQPQEYAGEIAQAMQYQPRTGTGAQLSRMAGEALAPLATLPTATIAQGAQAIGSSAGAIRGMAGANAGAMAAQDAQLVAGAPKLTAGTLADLVRAPKQSTMAGGGAAATEEAALRAQRFADAGIKPTQGQLSRKFDQVKFEREAAKTKEGAALNDRYAEQNAQMGRYLDDMTDATGAESSGLRATGKAVTDALTAKKMVKKSEISDAYNKARQAGDMAEQVDISPVQAYIEKNRSAMRNAPILATAEDEIARLTGGTGKLSINDLEELRKMVGKAGKPNASNANAGYTPDLIRLIDDSTAGKGGPAYQQARRMYENYSKEFADRDVIDKLLRNKPGTKDRAVAYEDVMQHSLLNGSLDDTKHVFRVLEAYPKGTPPEVVAAGQQAAKELRGSLMNHIKESVFSNAGADTAGNAVGSAAKFKRLVTELDKDGKLEAVFGKRGAQQIRDAKDLATDLYTSPTGTVNASNNANTIVAALDKVSDLTSRIPIVGGVAKYAAKRAESRDLSKKVDAALNPKLSDMKGDK